MNFSVEQWISVGQNGSELKSGFFVPREYTRSTLHSPVDITNNFTTVTRECWVYLLLLFTIIFDFREYLVDCLTQFQEVLLHHRDFGLNWLEVKVQNCGANLDISYIPPVPLQINQVNLQLSLAEFVLECFQLYRAVGAEPKHMYRA